jgi:hypothetical protein
MNSGRIALVLLYEPDTARHKPVALARVVDPRLVSDVARRAILDADIRADALAESDAVLGRMERAEANRLREVLAAALPDMCIHESAPPDQVM